MNTLFSSLRKLFIGAYVALFVSGNIYAQLGAPEGLIIPRLPESSMVYDTAEGVDIEVQILARGMNHPWAIAFLPSGDILVTEKNSGQLRLIRDDVLADEPVTGVPEVVSGGFTGLLGIVLHPEFEKSPYVYLSYNKPLPDNQSAVAVARGLWDGRALQKVR